MRQLQSNIIFLNSPQPQKNQTHHYDNSPPLPPTTPTKQQHRDYCSALSCAGVVEWRALEGRMVVLEPVGLGGEGEFA